jgi:hypothetical protein
LLGKPHSPEPGLLSQIRQSRGDGRQPSAKKGINHASILLLNRTPTHWHTATTQVGRAVLCPPWCAMDGVSYPWANLVCLDLASRRDKRREAADRSRRLDQSVKVRGVPRQAFISIT